jgi:ribosomal protein S1
MYNPSKKAKYSFPKLNNTQQPNNTIHKITIIENKIDSIKSNIIQINNSIDININKILYELKNLNKTQYNIKTELINLNNSLNSYLISINNKLETISTSCNILAQNQQKMASILFNGDSSMITELSGGITAEVDYYC